MTQTIYVLVFVFFFQAEDGIRDDLVTGVQTCALPIWAKPASSHKTSPMIPLVVLFMALFTRRSRGKIKPPAQLLTSRRLRRPKAVVQFSDEPKDFALGWAGLRPAWPFCKLFRAGSHQGRSGGRGLFAGTAGADRALVPVAVREERGDRRRGRDRARRQARDGAGDGHAGPRRKNSDEARCDLLVRVDDQADHQRGGHDAG